MRDRTWPQAYCQMWQVPAWCVVTEHKPIFWQPGLKSDIWEKNLPHKLYAKMLSSNHVRFINHQHPWKECINIFYFLHDDIHLWKVLSEATTFSQSLSWYAQPATYPEIFWWDRFQQGFWRGDVCHLMGPGQIPGGETSSQSSWKLQEFSTLKSLTFD